jgi:hypothetical protein
MDSGFIFEWFPFWEWRSLARLSEMREGRRMHFNAGFGSG